MEKYYFDKASYDDLYNCSRYTPEQWHDFGVPNKVIGVLYTLVGVMYEVLYFPCLYTMSSYKFLKLSCYKIMFFLGIIDMACIFINSILAGYFAWHGNTFCDHQELMYISGSISTGLWCAACMACMMLAMNRCCDLLKPDWMETLFSGWRTYLWLLAPTLYGSYFIVFTPPLIFTSVYDGAFFDPFVGTPISDKERVKYTSWPHTINNVIVIVVLCTAYSCICVYVCIKARPTMGGHRSTGMNALQKQIIAQATLICMLILIAASVYVRMQFAETSSYMVIVGQITWQSSHGGTVFIYLFLNRSMRNEIRNTFLPKCLTKRKAVTTTTTPYKTTPNVNMTFSSKDTNTMGSAVMF